jgi:DNA primase
MTKTKKYKYDFAKIKRRVSLKMVLDRYGVKLKPAGKNWVASCPVHGGDNPRAFSADLDKNGWRCFTGCDQGGNVLDLVALKEFGDKKPSNINKAARLLNDWFPGSGKANSGDFTKKTTTGKEPAISAPPAACGGQQTDYKKSEARTNQPLKFELKHLDPDHLFFSDRGLLPATVNFFGLGFQANGKFIGNRIAIPLHDEKGVLLGYAGKALTEEQAAADGKYKYPGGFLKSIVVYNLHRLQPGHKLLIVVESPISVWWLYQNGWPNVVSLLGSSLSEEQVKLIASYFVGRKGGIILLLDNDQAGQNCLQKCLSVLAKRLFVTAPDFSHLAKKPHLIKPECLKTLL